MQSSMKIQALLPLRSWSHNPVWSWCSKPWHHGSPETSRAVSWILLLYILSPNCQGRSQYILYIFLSEQTPTRWGPQSGQGFQCRWTGGQLATENKLMVFHSPNVILISENPWKLKTSSKTSLDISWDPNCQHRRRILCTKKATRHGSQGKHGKGCGQPSFVVLAVLVGTFLFSQNCVWKHMEGLPCKQGVARFCFVYHCRLKTLRISQGIHPWIDAGCADSE